MKLIELIVKNVKREGIPEDACFFAQDADDALIFWYSEKPIFSQTKGYWDASGDSHYLEIEGDIVVSPDAAETVVTREELMRAYDLVEQGYTLWFGGECPVERETLVDYVCENGFIGVSVLSKRVRWSKSAYDDNIIAYRLSRSIDTSVTNARDAAPLVELDHADTIVATAIEKRVEVTDIHEWSVKADKICINLKTGLLAGQGDNLVIITRAQWDDYVSRKIRVGDKAKTLRGTVVRVLFVTHKTALVEYEDGTETSFDLTSLTRLSQ